jgi:asparagine synthase (glutamine-hydrolysing)
MPAALLLVHRPAGRDDALDAAFERVAAAFPATVRDMAADDYADGAVRVRTWTHDSAVGRGIERQGDAWAAVLGNPTRAGLPGPAEIPARILADGPGGLDSLSPPFAVAMTDGAGVRVAVDRCGLQHLYVRAQPDGTTWISSSLLALADALGGTLDADAAAEWLAVGHFISERTMVREVRKLGAGEHLRLGAGGAETVARWRAEPQPPATDADYRDAFLEAVRTGEAEALTAAELTGGLDSRLVLAARVHAGTSRLAWTIGSPESAEVRTIRRLQRAVPFEHVIAGVGTGADAVEAVLAMHALADGEVNALEYANLLQAFPAAEGRWKVSLSGSGGEIARGYYYAAIKDGKADAGALMHKFGSATRPALALLRHDRFPDPLAPLRGALEDFLASGADGSPELAMEDVYIRGRMQRFGGRNVTTTGHFFRQSLPFFDNTVVEASLGLPARRKAGGEVVRDAIAAWTPPLARIPLDSGIAVAPRDWRHPTTQARWAAAMGRKALVRYGGSAGRALARPAPSVVDWDGYRADPGFGEFVRATLPASGARVHELLDPARTAALVDAALAGGSLYPLGLVLTLELTLRRLSA